jgi:hypothetical protein
MVGGWVVALLAVAAAQGQGVELGSAARAPGPGDVAHSHNDYEQPEPLQQALRAGFRSVEADVWWRGGEIVVSHSMFTARGRLEDLYLRPLQARVDALGSVLGDGRPFYLWIDLKQSSRELTEALHRTLMRYRMIRAFDDDGASSGPVVVVLTGDEDAKRRYVEEHVLRFACRDSNELGPADAPSDGRWSWYALAWGDVLGDGPSSASGPAALQRLQAVVARVHRLGRRLRMYRVPDRIDAWAIAVAAGADLVSTDHIEAFRDYLEARIRAERERTVSGRMPGGVVAVARSSIAPRDASARDRPGVAGP